MEGSAKQANGSRPSGGKPKAKKKVYYTVNPGKGVRFAGFGVYCTVDKFCTSPYPTREQAEERLECINLYGMCHPDFHKVVPVYEARGGGKRRDLTEAEEKQKQASMFPDMDPDERAALEAAIADGLLDMDTLVESGT